MLYNFIILFTANRRLPEFSGYEANTYPGQPPPRDMKVEPRRYSLPPSFVLDWKKMRSNKRVVRIVIHSPPDQTNLDPGHN